uniref:Tumor necrosis factor receptor superfamily member 5 n=1 Tax=Nannospalax galili TaxID=1026970 RepID=A0A8C6QHK5_NANGA
MVRVALLCALWGCLLTAVHLEPATVCQENQYSFNGRCCDLCQPGKKLLSECTEHTRTQCLPCSQGEFLDTWNKETYCHQHRYCEPNQGLQVWREGTSETDTTCVCQEGQYCISSDCDSCALHTECGLGFGVKQMGTGKNDTVCEPCPVGFFSNVSSAVKKCQSWTSCEANNLVVLQEGTRQTDAVCGKVAKKPKDKVSQAGKSDWWTRRQRQDPTEVEDVPGQNPATPVQETLHGCQPVTQEDGKESRISVQEKQ